MGIRALKQTSVTAVEPAEEAQSNAILPRASAITPWERALAAPASTRTKDSVPPATTVIRARKPIYVMVAEHAVVRLSRAIAPQMRNVTIRRGFAAAALVHIHHGHMARIVRTVIRVRPAMFAVAAVVAREQPLHVIIHQENAGTLRAYAAAGPASIRKSQLVQAAVLGYVKADRVLLV